MARPTILTQRVFEQMEQFLEVGCTIDVTCSAIGISARTFYNWQAESARLCALADSQPHAIIRSEDALLLQFFQMVKRAQAAAHAVATFAVRSALVEHRTTETEPYIYRETRLRTTKDGEEVPYTYEETRMRVIERVTPPDWRAGIEFLKRRDPANWNPPTKVEVSFEEQAVAYIRAGEVEFEDMEAEYGYDLASALFNRAGKAVPARTAAAARAAAPANRSA